MVPCTTARIHCACPRQLCNLFLCLLANQCSQFADIVTEHEQIAYILCSSVAVSREGMCKPSEPSLYMRTIPMVMKMHRWCKVLSMRLLELNVCSDLHMYLLALNCNELLTNEPLIRVLLHLTAMQSCVYKIMLSAKQHLLHRSILLKSSSFPEQDAP